MRANITTLKKYQKKVKFQYLQMWLKPIKKKKKKGLKKDTVKDKKNSIVGLQTV